MYDVIKASLGFGLYRFATTEFEKHVAGALDEPYEQDLIDRLTATRRRIGAVEAAQLRDLAAFVAARPGTKYGERFSEYAADEIAVAMRWTRSFAFARLHLALTVTTRLPGTLAALTRGDVDLRGVQVLAELTDPLDDRTARAVEEAVLPRAGGWNNTELRRAARRAVARLDPNGAEQRHRARTLDRKVELLPADDATAELRAYLPAVEATQIYRRLDAFARAAAPGDQRTMDQRRADVFCDLLLQTTNAHHDIGNGTAGGGASGKCGNGALVQVTVPATTLMGLDEQPGELAGYGPIPAAVARDIAAGGTWKRLLTDPVTGMLVDYGRNSYRPSAALADFVRARDHRCVFPGCSRPADACDIDHRRPWPDGPTSEENLECLCRHHHRLKHEAGWTVGREHGAFVWTTPDGHRYTRPPEPIAQPQPQPPPHPKPELADPDDEPPPF